jgi:CubicO group peptidase (beta-lactamase class C family)
VEVVSGEPIDVFARRNIFGPLGMKDTMYNPPDALDRRIAATEIVDGAPLRGTVHDPLARLMGGVSGNAGVFSTARDLAIYCRMLLNGGVHKGERILSPTAVELLTGVQSHGRAYGFDVSSSYAWLKGDHASERAFCHSGYTGTSIVCDPEKRVFLIILTNRAHPNDKGASKPIRAQAANIAFGAFKSR